MTEHKIRTVCEWKGIDLLELNIRKDHVHIVATISPRMSISDAMGIKGKDSESAFQGTYESQGEAILSRSKTGKFKPTLTSLFVRSHLSILVSFNYGLNSNAQHSLKMMGTLQK